MDIILEVVDTFVFDKVYAYLLPAQQIPMSSSDYAVDGLNKTAEIISTAWSYVPATSYLTLQPRAEAWMSAWPRDYILRQFISLFAITWSVYPTLWISYI